MGRTQVSASLCTYISQINCFKSNMKLIFLFLVINLRLQCSQGVDIGTVRLVGGISKEEGRVEIYYNQSWGTICDDFWGLKDVNVVCRSLNLENATNSPYRAAFGKGTGPIWMDDVNCQGSESSLLECPHAGFGQQNCGHGEDAGVVCGYPSLVKFTITNLTGVITSPGFPQTIKRANYEWTFKHPRVSHPFAALYFEEIDLTRINRGKSELVIRDTGNVTVLQIQNDKRKQKSGWIVKDPWKMSFYSSFTIMHSNGHSGKGMHLQYFIFSGLDQQQSCNSNWNVQVSAGVGTMNVSWSALAQVSNYKYLIIYNATGRDEIKNFTMVTDVTSTRIEYLLTNTIYSVQIIGFPSPNVASRTYSCVKNVKTKKATFRLVGGATPIEGVVQVDYHDNWGTICAVKWDINDANVVCRSKGLPPATFALTRTDQFNVSRGNAWVTSLECLGNESSLVECRHGGWGNLQLWCNRHSYAAGVVCGLPKVTKLVVTNIIGVITSPGYPRSMKQAHYEWTFRPQLSYPRVIMYFEDISLVRHRIGFSNLTVTTADGIQQLSVLNQKKPQFSYLFNKIPLKVTFFSSFTVSTSTKGFRMFYLVINDKIRNALLKDTWNVSAAGTSPHSITVTWLNFTDKDSTLIGYFITSNSTKRPNDNVFYSIADQNSSIVINNLMGYDRYRIQVFAHVRKASNALKLYKSKELFVSTPEGVPARPPPNITITIKNIHYVHVNWDPIPQEYVHGVLLGYNVVYQTSLSNSKKITITTTNQQVVLMDLLPSMYYSLQIAGFTAKGQGRAQKLNFRTKCGDVIKDQLQGVIRMPSISSRYWRVECEWTLKPGYKNALIVVMVGVVNRVPWYYPCRNLYISLINDKGHIIHKFCGKRQLVSLVSHGSAKVYFHSSGALPFKRETAPKATYYVFKNGFDEVSLYPDWKITATNHNSSTINVYWSNFPKLEGESVKFIAVCISKEDETQISAAYTNSSGESVQIKNLKAYTDYMIQVLAFFGNSSDPNWIKRMLKSQIVILRTLKQDWNPRFPSKLDISNSVRIIIKGLSVLNWNQLYDFKFKKAVAHEVTLFCTNDKRCPSPSIRSRRSNPYIFIFTTEQVHFLPGYPMQLKYSYDPNKMLAAATFYVRFPPEAAGINHTDYLPQNLLLELVKASLGRIGKAINKTILSVSKHRRQNTPSPPQESANKEAGVIAGAVMGVMVSIVVIAAIVIVVRKHCLNKNDDDELVLEMHHGPEAEPETIRESQGSNEQPQGNQEPKKQEGTQNENPDIAGFGNHGHELEI